MRYSPHGCSFADIKKLWACLCTKHRIMHQAMFYLGLRFSEVRLLCRSDIDFYEHVIWIRKQKNATLNEKYPLPRNIEKILRSWTLKNYALIQRNQGLVFPSRCGGIIGPTAWCESIARARKEARLENDVYAQNSRGNNLHRITGHSAKAAMLQHAENKGLEFRQIQALGHHRSALSTMRYLGNPTENFDLKKLAVRKLW